jgi:hypothetical protein
LSRRKQAATVNLMSFWEAGLWGFLGVLAIEAFDLYQAIRRVKNWPWKIAGEVSFGPYLISVIIRVILGAGAAAAFGASGQLTSPIGALAVGISAPLLLERLARAATIDTAIGPNTENKYEQVGSKSPEVGADKGIAMGDHHGN